MNAATCTTHHHACDCREAKIRQILEAAKYLAIAHEHCLALSFPVADDADEGFNHYRDIAAHNVAEIRKLWNEIKWD